MGIDPMETHQAKVDDLEHEVQGIKTELSSVKTDVAHLSAGQDVIQAKLDGIVNAVAGLSAQKGTVSTGMIVSIVAVLISFATVVIGGGAFFHNSLLGQIKESAKQIHYVETELHDLETQVAVNEERHEHTKRDILKWIDTTNSREF